MRLMTIFSAPKPFTNAHINIIQRNAIRSWLALPDVDVVLVGDETGMAEVCAEFGIAHLKDVAVNDKGTPLVSAIFAAARAYNENPLLCYVNADILLLPHIVERTRQALAQRDRFLLIGQRFDLDITGFLDFNPGWETRLQECIDREGVLHPPAGSDYFIFPRELYQQIPDFAIGRAGWDNWMIYHAVSQPWPAVDATGSIIIAHQNHDYHHLQDAQPHYKQNETLINAALGGGMRKMYMLLDAEREMIAGVIRPPRPRPVRWIRAAERVLQPEGEVGSSPRWRVTRALRKLRRRLLKESS